MRNQSHRPVKGHPIADRIVSRRNTGSEAIPMLTFLQQQFADMPRTRLKSMLRYGHIRIAGIEEVRHDTPVEPEATVEVNLARPFITFSHPRLKLVYEDNDILVVNKGYGLLSMGTPSSRKDVTAYSVLKDYVKSINPLNKVFINQMQ